MDTLEGQSGVNFESIATRLQAAAAIQLDVAAFFQSLDAHFVADERRVAALARILQIYTSKRRKDRKRKEPSYGRTFQEISQLSERLKRIGLAECLSMIAPSMPQSFRQFLNGVSNGMNGGTGTYRLFAFFLLWIIFAYPAFKNEIRLTVEDLRLLEELEDHWGCLQNAIEKDDPQQLSASPLSALAGRKPLEDKEIKDVEVMRRYVASFFHFSEDRRSNFHTFFKSVMHGDDGCAHLICYRPQLSNPVNFVKSFLAIVPPQKNGMSRDYTFTHIYKIDLDSDHVRKTTGVVLPMISGLYFVGGQEQRSADTQNGSSNYRTLKVIAAQWLPVERNQLVIPALVLSTNNREEIIISRLALRRTLITDHVSAEVGIISSEKLEDDLQKLVDVEMSSKELRPLLLPSGVRNVKLWRLPTTGPP